MRATAFRAILLMLLVLPASTAFTAGPEYLDNYYTDNTYTTACGYVDNDHCDDTYSQGGTLTNYRFHEIINCTTGNEPVAECEEYDSGTATWVAVTCPDQVVTIDGRLRVPTGH
jgi:hypothetical protein